LVQRLLTTVAAQREGGCAIAVMAKAPLPGAVKTRLVPPLRSDEAAALGASFLRDVTENVALAARDAAIHGYVAYAPSGSERLFDGMLAARTRLVLADGAGISAPRVHGFGRCLLHAAGALFAGGHDAVCLLNSDSPTLPTRLIARAASALNAPGERVVLGQADDGGYYIVGMKAPHVHLFEDIAWSTATVAAQTRQRAHALNLPVTELDPWYDVDDGPALRRLIRELKAGGGAGELAPYPAPATAACIERLMLRDVLAAE
jgi:rSAM/selenodomain-associated transferase 1